MVTFQSLLSSSSGNSTFVSDGKTNILIDCGTTGSYIENCLTRLGIGGKDLSAIFLTHSHSDHIAAAGILSRKYDLPLYATQETFDCAARQIGAIDERNIHIISCGDNVFINELTIHVFPIPHDSPGAVSFTIADNESKFGIATDSGFISDEILDNLSECDTVIVEANHDVDMLMHGRYPYHLKKRILSSYGHMSNDLCGELCVKLASCRTRAFWLGHISDKNNTREKAFLCVSRILSENGFTVGSDVALNVIPKYWNVIPKYWIEADI